MKHARLSQAQVIASNAWAEPCLVKQHQNTVWSKSSCCTNCSHFSISSPKKCIIASTSLPLPTGVFPMLADHTKCIVQQADWGLSQGVGNRFLTHFFDYLYLIQYMKPMNNMVYQTQYSTTFYIFDLQASIHKTSTETYYMLAGVRGLQYGYFPGGPNSNISSNNVSNRLHCLWPSFLVQKPNIHRNISKTYFPTC